jgi:hypothetical protein
VHDPVLVDEGHGAEQLQRVTDRFARFS